MEPPNINGHNPMSNYQIETQSTSSRISDKTTSFNNEDANPQTYLVLNMLRIMQESNDKNTKDLKITIDDLKTQHQILEHELTESQTQNKMQFIKIQKLQEQTSEQLKKTSEIASQALNLGNDAKQSLEQSSKKFTYLEQLIESLNIQDNNANTQIQEIQLLVKELKDHHQTTQTKLEKFKNLDTTVTRHNRDLEKLDFRFSRHTHNDLGRGGIKLTKKETNEFYSKFKD